RIATEIKLHKSLNSATYDFYRSVTPLGEGAYEALSDTRDWSWKLVFVTEIALCVSTGRTGSVQGLSVSTPGAPLAPRLEPGDANYDLTALIHLNRIYAKAIVHSNSLQDSETGHAAELRQTFKAEWQRDLHAWATTWTAINPLVRLVAQHNTTILLSISLRFKGPVAPVLEECRLSALETAKMAVLWDSAVADEGEGGQEGEGKGESLRWAGNLVVVNIAYAATLLLRIKAVKGPIDAETRLLCARVADVLTRIGEMRPTVRTLATVHGTRIHALLAADLPKHAAVAAAAAHAAASKPGSPLRHSAVPSAANTAPPSPLPGPPSPLPPSLPGLDPTADLAPSLAVPPHAPPHAASFPSLFDLTPSDSHLLWDLFDDHSSSTHPFSATAGVGAGMGFASAAALELGGGAGVGGEGAGQEGRGTDAWLWKSASDQDWLSSEPGAWAW
ncbi:hypothetical protein JCM10207_002522, partial [Rhodosporidiobolus poonsookiae]